MATSLRGILRSPAGRAATTIFIVVLVLVFAVDATRSFLVINVHGVETGTLLWLAAVLKAVSSIIAVVCLLLALRFWSWAILAWASLTSIIALVGLLMGLKPEFLARWDVVLAYVVLAMSLVFETPFAMPGSNQRVD